MTWKDSNWAFKYIREFKLNLKIYIRILMCKMWGLESLCDKISRGPPKSSILGLYILLKIVSDLCNAQSNLIKYVFIW